MKLETRESMAAWAREQLSKLVDDGFLNAKSRVVAVADAGREIGRSPSWVKRLLARSENLVVAGHDVINIANACDRLADRREARQEAERLRTETIRGDAEAVLARVKTDKRRPQSGLRYRRAPPSPKPSLPSRFARAAQHLNCPALGRV